MKKNLNQEDSKAQVRQLFHQQKDNPRMKVVKMLDQVY